MTTKRPRDTDIERILDRQMRLWESQRLQHPNAEAPVWPNLTLSQRPYAGAESHAERLAGRLGWELYDRQIVDALHRRDELGKSVLESLDQRLLSFREDWIYHLLVPGHTSNAAYVQRLSRLVFSIAMRGQAVFLGRGASFIVPHDHRLAVLVCRSFETRLEIYVAEHGGTHEHARRELARVDRERGEFIAKSFHRDVDDPTNYDLCVNLDSMSLDAVESVVLQALRARFPHFEAAHAHR